MAITRVRAVTAAGTVTNGGSVACSFGTAPAVGNVIVVYVTINQGAAPASMTSGELTDNQSGNTYSICVQSAASAENSKSAIYYLPAVVGSTGTFTVTYTRAAIWATIYAVEWSGLAATSLDKTASAIGSGTAPAVATGTLAQADELVVACLAGYAGGTEAITKDAAFTEDYIITNGASFGAAEGSYQIVAATTTVTSTWTTDNRNYGICIASFKGAAAAAGPFPPWPSNAMLPLLAQ